jgi:hypothetical protein
MSQTIIVKRVGQEPVVESRDEITLEVMKEIVGGHIELLRLPHGIDLWLNEEGKIIELEPNIVLGSEVIVGDVFLSGSTLDGDTVGLTELQEKAGFAFFGID